MYGTQAQKKNFRIMKSFENDVKMYGTQADLFPLTVRISLRMM